MSIATAITWFGWGVVVIAYTAFIAWLFLIWSHRRAERAAVLRRLAESDYNPERVQPPEPWPEPPPGPDIDPEAGEYVENE